MTHFEVINKKWEELEKIINELYCDNPFLTPYQSWDYLNITGKGFTAHHPFNTFRITSENFVIYKDKKAIAILPLLINNKKVVLRGTYTGAGNLDLIYSKEMTYEMFKFLIDYARQKLSGRDWGVDRISEKSLTFQYWNKYLCNSRKVSTATCVEIPFSDYEKWFCSLSKSVRQNIRTSYNRAKTDGCKIETEILYDNMIPQNIFDDIIRIASKRALEYDGYHNILLNFIYYLLKKRDPLIQFVKIYKHCFCAIIRINYEIAAFLIGLHSNDARIIVPRLSYNSYFYRYSPGGMLINETIKALTSSDCPYEIKSLDLSRGTEKYKYDYGGIEHLNYSFNLL